MNESHSHMKITKAFTFEASHILPEHTGQCRRLHGHSWRLTVGLEGPQRGACGFVLDYAVLKQLIAPLVEALDHSHLNDYLLVPSCENLVQWLGSELEPLSDLGWVVSLTLCETSGTSCHWDGQTFLSFPALTQGIGEHTGPNYQENRLRLHSAQVALSQAIAKLKEGK